MTRRVSLPGVDELFRSSKASSPEADADSRNGDANLQIVKDTDVLGDEQPPEAGEAPPAPAPVGQDVPRVAAVGDEPAAVAAVALAPVPDAVPPAAPPAPGPAPAPEPAATPAPAADPDEGKRPRHEEKVTFYCTGSDLTRIERARLTLRAEHRLASDRGRIVRAALAEILDDFERRGADSALVARLRGRSDQ